MKTKSTDMIMQNKIFVYGAIATGLILLIPLVSGWPWTLSDFVVMGTLIYSTGSLFVFLARKFPAKRIAIGVIVMVAFLWLWAELAVGLFTNWGS